MHFSLTLRHSALHEELLFRAQLIFCPCVASSSWGKLLTVCAVPCGGWLQGVYWPLSNTLAWLTLSLIIFWSSSPYPAVAVPTISQTQQSIWCLYRLGGGRSLASAQGFAESFVSSLCFACDFCIVSRQSETQVVCGVCCLIHFFLFFLIELLTWKMVLFPF